MPQNPSNNKMPEIKQKFKTGLNETENLNLQEQRIK